MLQRELKQDRSKFWKEQYPQASVWKPCADKKAPKSIGILGSTDYCYDK